METALIDTTTVDSGASGWYFRTGAPVTNVDRTTAMIREGTATGQAQQLDATCTLPLPDIPPGLFGHIIGGFCHTLLGIGNFCDTDFEVVFTRRTVTIYIKNGKPFLRGWRELGGTKLWHISLTPDRTSILPSQTPTHSRKQRLTSSLHTTSHRSKHLSSTSTLRLGTRSEAHGSGQLRQATLPPSLV